MKIIQASQQDLHQLAELAVCLWPGHCVRELEEAFRETIEKSHGAFFLVRDRDAHLGFAQCQLRHDYVEGTQSSPVGYLEGIYVVERYRGQGVARALLSACEAWARDRGCTEFASDCEMENTQSLRFHQRLGFTEANRVICFTKKL